MDKQQADWRKNGIGSSDAPVIMGVSPWKTPYQLWQEKVFGVDDTQDNYAMARGRGMEEAARVKFESMKGVMVAPTCLEHRELNWMRASLDGLDFNRKIAVEIKCPGREDHESALKGIVPEKYKPQLQHQIEVAGLDGMYYFSFNGQEGVIIEVERDGRYIHSLKEKESILWQMVQNKTPPELTPDDFIDMSHNREWEDLAEEWRAIKALQDREEDVRNRLKSLSGGRNAKGHGVSLQRQIQAGGVDYKEIPELKGLDLNPYRKKPFEKWVFRSM